MKNGKGMQKSRNQNREKNPKTNGYSDYSKESQDFSNISMESLKIRVKPATKQASDSSADKYFYKDFSNEQMQNSKENLQKKPTEISNDDSFVQKTSNISKRKSAIMLNSRASFIENRLSIKPRQFDLNILKEYMEKFPVLKLDMVTSLEKKRKKNSKLIMHRG